MQRSESNMSRAGGGIASGAANCGSNSIRELSTQVIQAGSYRALFWNDDMICKEMRAGYQKLNVPILSLSGWWFGTSILFSQKYWEFHHHPNWRTHIFQRGGPTTNQHPWHRNWVIHHDTKGATLGQPQSSGWCNSKVARFFSLTELCSSLFLE